MNVSLTPALEDYIRRKVATGPYDNASAVVREALRLMRERETGGRPAPQKDRIAVALRALEPELRRRGIVSLALFGSLVRGEARPDSDIDVLVAVDPAANFDLLDLVAARNLIGDALGYKIDIVEQDSLKPPVREAVMTEAESVF